MGYDMYQSTKYKLSKSPDPPSRVLEQGHLKGY